jgi:hypothetical protein
MPNVHSHFINITRFANRSPHIFATASFDHSCKVWDLRQPLLRDQLARLASCDPKCMETETSTVL